MYIYLARSGFGFKTITDSPWWVRIEFTLGIIQGCWLTAAIYYFSSELEGRVSARPGAIWQIFAFHCRSFH